MAMASYLFISVIGILMIIWFVKVTAISYLYSEQARVPDTKKTLVNASAESFWVMLILFFIKNFLIKLVPDFWLLLNVYLPVAPAWLGLAIFLVCFFFDLTGEDDF